MEHTERDTVIAGPYSYLGLREDSVQGDDHFISIADRETRVEVARAIKTQDGAISLQTFGPPLPRIVAEHLFKLAELKLY